MSSQGTEQLKATVARNIDTAISESGRTNRDIGVAMGASETQVWKWRKGKHGIGQPNLVALAEELGRDLLWFYTDHGSKAAA